MATVWLATASLSHDRGAGEWDRCVCASLIQTLLQHCIFVNQPVEESPESLPQSVFSRLKLIQHSQQLDISQ